MARIVGGATWMVALTLWAVGCHREEGTTPTPSLPDTAEPTTAEVTPTDTPVVATSPMLTAEPSTSPTPARTPSPTPDVGPTATLEPASPTPATPTPPPTSTPATPSPSPTPAVDLDEDGFPAENDCDEANAAINPGQTEVCNGGIDDDCDGIPDAADAVDSTAYYADQDHDGYGDPFAQIRDCVPPQGFVSDNSDCNDRSAAAYPGAAEVCNGKDDDCDGAKDSGLTGNEVLCAAHDCYEVIEHRRDAGDGRFWIDPDGEEGPVAPFQAYCDNKVDGGGWMLVAKLSQPTFISKMSETTYNAWFRDASWIVGQAEGIPADPSPNYDTYHAESLHWARVLKVGDRYRLRQTFFRNQGENKFDVSYRFWATGALVQNDVPEYARTWTLFSRRVISDSTAITWNFPPQITRFWLPFTPGFNDRVYSGCGGFDFDDTGCSSDEPLTRRFGNAGIIGSQADGLDPAASFAPWTDATGDYDLVRVGQAESLYGKSGVAMTLLYWIRPERVVGGGEICGDGLDNDNDGVMDEGSVGMSPDKAPRDCAAVLSGCASGKAADGVYWVDPEGTGEGFQVYCDMTTDGGGWTLLSRFSQPASVDKLGGAEYTAWMESSAWIYGFAEAGPTSVLPDYNTFHAQSLDWGAFITAGQPHELRQQLFHDYGGLTFDAAWDVYPGADLEQNYAQTADRAWEMTDRRVFRDESGIGWDVSDEVVRFWLPFSPGYQGQVYAGCGGYYLGSSPCSSGEGGDRPFGNAGIIGANADGRDPAAAWAPYTNPAPGSDMVLVHQAPEVYGATGRTLSAQYWLRSLPRIELCGDGEDNDGDGLVDEALPGENVSCAVPSCRDILEARPGAATGEYWVQPLEDEPPLKVYCDMDLDGGGWTLCVRSSARDLSLVDYQSPWGAGAAISGGGVIGGNGCVRFAGSATDLRFSDGVDPFQRVVALSALGPMDWSLPANIHFSRVDTLLDVSVAEGTNSLSFRTDADGLTRTAVDGQSCPYTSVLVAPYDYCGGDLAYTFVQHTCGSYNCGQTSGTGVLEVWLR